MRLAVFGILLAGLLGAGASARAQAWKEACIAIEPTIACTVENRVAIEEAMLRCRNESDPASCHRRILAERQAQPTQRPTILRGGH